MHCIECGTQIPDIAKYCPNCGSKQTSVKPDFNPYEKIISIKEETAQKDTIKRKVSKDYKKFWVRYGYWFLFNLILLLVFSDGIFETSNSNGGIDDFWPFGGFGRDFADYYDFTEFVFYTGFPLVIHYIRRISK